MKARALLLALVVAIAGWFVTPWEGESFTGYRDIVGVATACVGHTGAGVVVGKVYTREQCRAWLQSDLGIAARTVQQCITVPLKSYEWAALTSAVFNLGPKVVCGSTLQTLANSGKSPQIWCQQLARWSYAGGVKVRGLERRRQAEIELCLGHT